VGTVRSSALAEGEQLQLFHWQSWAVKSLMEMWHGNESGHHNLFCIDPLSSPDNKGMPEMGRAAFMMFSALGAL